MLSTKFFLRSLFTLIFFFMLMAGTVTSQVLPFQKTLGGFDDDGAFSMINTFDGGFIITGNTQSYGNINGADDILLLKTDASGTVEWTKSYGDSLRENASCIRQTADSGYYITGRTYSTGFGPADVFLLRIDKTGNIIFFYTYGNTGYEVAQSLEITDDGGCIITGGTYSVGAGDQDLFLLKTDNTGQMQWYKIYGTSQYDHGTCIKITPAGDYIIGGRSNFYGSMDILFLKTNKYGELLWNKLYRGPLYEESYNITIGLDGDYLVSGTTNSFTAGLTDIVLIKTDTMGNIKDSRIYGGSEADAGYSVCTNRDSGFTVTGYSEGFNNILIQPNGTRGTDSANVFVFRVNNNLDTLWTSIFGGGSTDESFCVVQTPDSGFAIAAVEKSYDHDSSNVYLIKTDPLGNGECQQAYVSPVIGVPNFTTDSLSLALDTTGFLSGPNTISVFLVSIDDSTLCQFVQAEAEIENQQEIHIYPVPFSYTATVYCPMIKPGSHFTFQLVDLLGKVQQQFPVYKQETRLNRGDLKSGIYFYRVFDTGVNVASGKIVILE